MKTWKLAGALLALALFTLESASLAADFSGVVNVNTATVEELEQLPGIGASRARALVEARERRGGFGSVDELVEVKGIGEASLDRLRPHLTTEGPTTARVE
ncbi:MAG: helix-hairpin-helix domain-containing protein [Thermoleophilia bacterium]|nr:helix-hairpin-helix domain-containing protein [Thermoleophilia bacterium]